MKTFSLSAILLLALVSCGQKKPAPPATPTPPPPPAAKQTTTDQDLLMASQWKLTSTTSPGFTVDAQNYTLMNFFQSSGEIFIIQAGLPIPSSPQYMFTYTLNEQAKTLSMTLQEGSISLPASNYTYSLSGSSLTLTEQGSNLIFTYQKN